jgi:hypothetical protein
VTGDFLEALKCAADQASDAEESFRREIAARMKGLERERAFAWRRLNLMRGIDEVIAPTANEEDAVAAADAALRLKLGWGNDSPARSEVLSRFAAVSRAVFANRGERAEIDVVATLASFEEWYRDTHPGPFWALFDYEMPETPVVDF